MYCLIPDDFLRKLVNSKILAVTNCDGGLLSNDWAWTIVEFQSSPYPRMEIDCSIHPTCAFFRCLDEWLDDASQSWEFLTLSLEDYLGFNSLSSESDQDIFEDATFSKSRRYFWAIKTLNKFIRTIEDTLRTWESSRVEWLKLYQVNDVDVSTFVREYISCVEEHHSKLSLSCQLQKTRLSDVIMRRYGVCIPGSPHDLFSINNKL